MSSAAIRPWTSKPCGHALHGLEDAGLVVHDEHHGRCLGGLHAASFRARRTPRLEHHDSRYLGPPRPARLDVYATLSGGLRHFVIDVDDGAPTAREARVAQPPRPSPARVGRRSCSHPRPRRRARWSTPVVSPPPVPSMPPELPPLPSPSPPAEPAVAEVRLSPAAGLRPRSCLRFSPSRGRRRPDHVEVLDWDGLGSSTQLSSSSKTPSPSVSVRIVTGNAVMPPSGVARTRPPSPSGRPPDDHVKDDLHESPAPPPR